MKQYIEREKLLFNRPEMRNPNYKGKEEYHAGWNACCKEFYDLIKNSPTQDVVSKSEIAKIFEEIEQEAYKNEEGDLYLDLPDYLKIKNIVLSALIGITIFVFYSAGVNVFFSILFTLIIYLGVIALYKVLSFFDL